MLRPDGTPVTGASVWIERELCRYPIVAGDVAAGEGASNPTRAVLNASQFTIRRSGERSVLTFGARGHALRLRIGERVQTDARGHYALAGVPVGDGVHLVVFDPGGVPCLRPLEAGTKRLDVVLPARTHLEVLSGVQSPAFDRVHLEDLEGQLVPLWSLTGERVREHPWTNFDGHRTDIVVAPAGELQCVLSRDGVEVARLALTLEPGEVNRITP